MRKVIETERLILKALDGNKAVMLLNFLIDGSEEFERYETQKDINYYTVKYQKQVLSTEYNLMKENKYVRYYVFLKGEPDIIIGTVSFGFFRQFPFASSNIGYKFLKRYQGNGYASEAIKAAIAEVFRELNHHQIYAYIMPENEASIKLIERLGFSYEGLSKKCLCVRGKWEDHYVYKLLSPYEV
ncbi:MAG: GNAT family N-acetyltransferase [Lachnospiraceae bacterium]|nr:GNAT family N-acetyltransferase [Lachnospiraceae bacterium]